MPEFNVTFTQYHNYIVEAESASQAEEIAEKEFTNQMRCAVAQTWYDECEVEEME